MTLAAPFLPKLPCRISQLSLVCFGLLLIVSPARATEMLPGITAFQINTFAANCLGLLERAKFAETAALFHLDPQLSLADQQIERQDLAATLAAVNAEFGHLEAAEPLAAPRKAHQFVLQGMTSDYWSQFSRYQPASYQVNYARAGAGFLTFAIVVYDHRLQLRAISFGLPVERDEEDARIKALINSLHQPAAKSP